MKRLLMNDLIKWKEKRNRKPLIIRGARQVGKTRIMKEFGRLHYKNSIYINFDNNERMKQVFSLDMDIKRIFRRTGFHISGQTKHYTYRS